jgi:hypothetical protein
VILLAAIAQSHGIARCEAQATPVTSDDTGSTEYGARPGYPIG